MNEVAPRNAPTPPGGLLRPFVAEEEAPAGEPDDFRISLRWTKKGRGLRGEILAVNTGRRTCRLGPRPTVEPFGVGGHPLPVGFGNTPETRRPPYVVLKPGQRAKAIVLWRNWCGERASGRVLVRWDGGAMVVLAEGPAQPECRRLVRQGLTSTWFDLVD